MWDNLYYHDILVQIFVLFIRNLKQYFWVLQILPPLTEISSPRFVEKGCNQFGLGIKCFVSSFFLYSLVDDLENIDIYV